MIKWKAAAVSLGTVLVLIASSAVPARAEEVEKKFRVGIAIGGYDTQSEVRSDAPNNLYIADEFDDVQDIIRDPRNDSASIGTLGINRSFRGVATAAYAFTRRFVVEGSVGYQKGDLGDVELQAQFPEQDVPDNQEFDMKFVRFKAGEVTQVPVQLTAFARFRPKAQINPYIGAGVGYIFIGFEPSSELNTISARMDASTGGFAPLTGAFGSRSFTTATSVRDLQGASVTARDTFEWHAAGGMEFSFKKSWSAYVDLRYIFASRAMEVMFDGAHSFGRAVPDTVYYGADPRIADQYGAIQIVDGGLVDAGRVVPKPTAPVGTDCTTNTTDCVFVAEPDGQLDPGFYYVQGGKIKYGGFALHFGVKYTF